MGGNEAFEILKTWFGTDWKDLVNRQTGQVTSVPEVFIGTDFVKNGNSVVEAAARGWKAAISIFQYLNLQVL